MAGLPNPFLSQTMYMNVSSQEQGSEYKSELICNDIENVTDYAKVLSAMGSFHCQPIYRENDPLTLRHVADKGVNVVSRILRLRNVCIRILLCTIDL